MRVGRAALERDLGTARLLDDGATHNVVATAGPAALILVPAAWALDRLRRLLHRS